MKEITQENYQQLEYNWEGIIIAYPKVDLYWNAGFYVYKQELNEKNEYIYKCCGYSKEDSVYDGFSGDWSKKDFESCFGNWDKLTYYQFKDLKEFCEWYLHKDDKLHQALEQFVEDTKKFYEKDWIHEKGNTNTPPSTVPKQPSKGNKLMSQDEVRDKINPGWNTRRAKLQDVLKLLELRDLRQNTIDMLVENMPPEKRCYLEKQLERDEKRIEDFLNERIY